MTEQAPQHEGLVRTSSAEIRRRQQQAGATDDAEEAAAVPSEAGDPPAGDASAEAGESEAAAERPGATQEPAQPSLGYRTIDDVVRRHTSDDADEGGEADGAEKSAARGRPRKKKKGSKKKSRKPKTSYPAAHAPAEEEPTPVEQTGMLEDKSVQVRTARDPVPYEGDPMQDPDVVSVGLIEPAEGEQFPDMSGAEARHPANLADICRMYHLGGNDGDCYLRVERKAPKTFQSQNMEGYLGKIRRPIDEAEFRDMAGGGVYEIVVWGPNPRGTIDPYTGQVEVKPLTKPIAIKMPGPPNFVDFDEDDQPGRRNMQAGWDPMERRNRVVPITSAEASIQKEALGFIKDSVKDAKQENQRLQQELKEKQKEPGIDSSVIDFLKSSSKEGIDAVKHSTAQSQAYLERQLEEEKARSQRLEQRLEQLSSDRQSAPDREYSGVAQLISALHPERDQSGEIQRIYDQHVRDMERMTAQHERAMEQLRSSYDDRLRGKDEELRRAQEHYDKRERELREDFYRREQAMKDDAARREQDLKDRYEQLISRQKEDHLRELENLKRQEELVRETHKVSYETRISSAEERARQAQEDAERAREEAAKKADLPGLIQEYSEVAGALGFKKDEEDQPKDWKERLAQSVGAAFENLPTLFERANETLQSRTQMVQAQADAMRAQAAARGQAPAPPARPQRPQRTIRGAGGAPVNVPRPAGWATEDGLSPRVYSPAEPEVRPDQRPPPTDDEKRRAEAERKHQEIHGAAPEAPPSQAAAAPPAAASGASAAASNGAQAQPGGPPMPPAMLDEMRRNFEQAYQNGAEPEEIADELHRHWGTEGLRRVLGQVSIDELIDALSADPKAASSPLLTRDGTNWFKRIWAAGEALVGNAA